MRVLWVIKTLGPGGAERLLVSQGRVHDRSRFDISCAFVTFDQDHLAPALEESGVSTACVSRGVRDMFWPLRLFWMIKKGRWDLVHVHSPLPAAVARFAVLLMSSSKRPVIVSTEHNSWNRFHPVSRWLNRLSSRFDVATIAVSGEVAESMRGVARKRAQVIRHGIDIEAVSGAVVSRERIRAALGLENSSIVIGTVASFTTQKDYPNLLASTRKLLDSGVSAQIVAVGQGPMMGEALGICDSLDLKDDVRFLGYRADSVEVMAAFDVFVLASRWEGLPVALMEACALGLPVVATNVGGIAEEFVEGQTAILVPARDSDAMADAMSLVVKDSKLRSRLGQASFLLSSNFDVRITQAFLEELYEEKVRARKQGAP